MATLFTKIIQRQIPAKIVYETDRVLAFEDLNPHAPHHVLLVPKIEIPTINDLTPDNASYIGDLFLAAKAIAAQLGINENGYRVVMNCNEDAGQSVPHIHLHLLGGRRMKWPPG